VGMYWGLEGSLMDWVSLEMGDAVVVGPVASAVETLEGLRLFWHLLLCRNRQATQGRREEARAPPALI
jgi:hypothetical protein